MDEVVEPSASCSKAQRRSSRIQAATNRPSKDSDSYHVGTVQKRVECVNLDAPRTTQSGRGGRRTWRNTDSPDPMVELMQPLTDEERRNWKGWVELESDPALFNYILREYGVNDIKIQEVLSLDDEMLAFLPKPIYGFIFLFKYRDDDCGDSTKGATCPNNVWFANQTTTNACATIALLNIVMNIPDLNLGSALATFKDNTRQLKPAYRGYALSHNDFIRNIHNSFARRMDIRNADLALSNEVQEWQRSQTKKKRKGSEKKKLGDEEEPGFHFVAYVPIDGVVWRLDGLQRQPVSLGRYREDWMAVARANIYQRISQYDDDGLQFNLLALCRSPLKSVPEQLAENIGSVLLVEEALTSVMSDWKQFVDDEESHLPNKADESFGLSQYHLNNSRLPESARRKLEDVGVDVTKLLDLRGEWMGCQKQLQISYLEEVALIQQENEQASRRRTDYTPIIYTAVKTLAESGILEDLVKKTQEKGGCIG